MTDELDNWYNDWNVEPMPSRQKEKLQALIDRECTKARIEAFDVAFDCHDYDRLRAYRAELLKEVK